MADGSVHLVDVLKAVVDILDRSGCASAASGSTSDLLDGGDSSRWRKKDGVPSELMGRHYLNCGGNFGGGEVFEVVATSTPALATIAAATTWSSSGSGQPIRSCQRLPPDNLGIIERCAHRFYQTCRPAVSVYPINGLRSPFSRLRVGA